MSKRIERRPTDDPLEVDITTEFDINDVANDEFTSMVGGELLADCAEPTLWAKRFAEGNPSRMGLPVGFAEVTIWRRRIRLRFYSGSSASERETALYGIEHDLWLVHLETGTASVHSSPSVEE